ncbi:MAG: hypothetical protein FWH46_04010 [Methanimicrococcus sp.]|nr:hypothetical protein [Methanimicrococcus sp.]
MKTDFTFGISEIDHLAGHKIESMSFLLLAGNDDEGMRSFLAEMKKSQGRHAKKEQKSWQFIKADLKNKNLLDEIANGFEIFETDLTTFETDPANQDTKKQSIICVIENLIDFSYSKEETTDLANLLKKAAALIKNAEQKYEIILIAVLYEGIFPTFFENQLKHLADSYFQFEMTKKYTDFERTLSIWKYKESNIGGKILRYVLQDGGFQIENKKRIY